MYIDNGQQLSDVWYVDQAQAGPPPRAPKKNGVQEVFIIRQCIQRLLHNPCMTSCICNLGTDSNLGGSDLALCISRHSDIDVACDQIGEYLLAGNESPMPLP